MLRSNKPTHKEIVLHELALARDRGISSYMAYHPDFPVKRLGARIWDLRQIDGIKIEALGGKERRYYLKSITPEAVAMVTKDPNLTRLLDDYLTFKAGYVEEMTEIDRKAAERTGKLVRVFDVENNVTKLVPAEEAHRWE